jgi:hypothetical protein
MPRYAAKPPGQPPTTLNRPMLRFLRHADEHARVVYDSVEFAGVPLEIDLTARYLLWIGARAKQLVFLVNDTELQIHALVPVGDQSSRFLVERERWSFAALKKAILSHLGDDPFGGEALVVAEHASRAAAFEHAVMIARRAKLARWLPVAADITTLHGAHCDVYWAGPAALAK